MREDLGAGRLAEFVECDRVGGEPERPGESLDSRWQGMVAGSGRRMGGGRGDPELSARFGGGCGGGGRGRGWLGRGEADVEFTVADGKDGREVDQEGLAGWDLPAIAEADIRAAAEVLDSEPAGRVFLDADMVAGDERVGQEAAAGITRGAAAELKRAGGVFEGAFLSLAADDDVEHQTRSRRFGSWLPACVPSVRGGRGEMKDYGGWRRGPPRRGSRRRAAEGKGRVNGGWWGKRGNGEGHLVGRARVEPTHSPGFGAGELDGLR